MEKTQQCTVYGYLYGAVCGDLRVWDRIPGARVIAVPSDRNEETVDSLARPNRDARKSVVHDIDEERFKGEAEGAIMRGETDADGAFCFENQSYDGGLIDVYVCIDRIPAPTLEKDDVRIDEPCYLFMGTYRPFKSGESWYLVMVVPTVIWCRIRRKADLWVIVGRVTPCEDNSVGLAGLTVTAKDVDLVQHDVLGSGNTNPSGIFRIDYHGSKFRQGTWLDVELFGGPDVFFEIKDSDGDLVLDEPSLRGRLPGRCDRGPCFCVHLCVEVPVPTDPRTPTVWTKVGNAFTIPDSASLHSFDADGYAGAPKYAFRGSIRMLGTAPSVSTAGNPIEYRFLVSDTTTPNGGPAPADANFSRIVGAGPVADVNLFASTEIGQVVNPSTFEWVDIDAIQADLDGDGWLDVNTSIARTFAAHPVLTPADIPSFQWSDGDALMAINTHAMTSEPNVPGGAGDPGDAVPAADRIGIERKAIRFQAREVVSPGVYNTLAFSGTTLNSIVVNNNAAYRKVAMAEHLSSTACTPLSGSPHVAFTTHHPHIAEVNIRVRSNDGTYDHNLNDAVSKPASSDAAIPLSGNTNSVGINHLHNPSVALPAGLHKCTYIVTLRVLRRLHTGDSAVTANFAQTSFYYEP